MKGQKESVFIPHDQNYYQIAGIQSVSLGLPAIMVGEQLANQYGTGVAICSILVGNLILWLIAMAIISMAIEDRTNAIQNVKTYLGNYGALFTCFVLIAAFLDWYVLQINSSVSSVSNYFGVTHRDVIIRLGAGLGFFTSLLAIGGIQVIKWITSLSLPWIFCYYVYAIWHSDFSISTVDSWRMSVPATISVLLVLLPGVVNLPTFFRHAKSRADCYLALTIMTLLISFFEIATIWMKFSNASIIPLENSWSLFSTLTLVFVVLTLICTNLLNIYFASACWEMFVPQFEGAKGYAIIGLMGTAAYTFIQIYTPVQIIEDLANCYIASLGTVLLIAFLVRIIVRHRPRVFEKIINGFCWFAGSLVSTLLILKNTQDNMHPLLMGISVSGLVFLFVIFIEETIWSVKKLTMNG